MKTVFPNRQVIHVWAQQSQPEGRNSNASLSFRDGTLYSYQTPIAHITHETIDRTRVALITTETYSTTTSGKHMPRSADFHAARVFHVPWIIAEGGRAPRGSHESNLAALVAAYTETVKRYSRMRTLYREPADTEAELMRMACNVADYAKLFGLTAPPFSVATDNGKIWDARAARDAKANDPLLLAKREKAKAAKLARDGAKLAGAIARYVADASYEPGDITLLLDCEYAYLRHNHEGTVYTSHGAEVSQADAAAFILLMRRALAAVAADTFEVYRADMSGSAEPYSIGLFQLRRITREYVQIGCHKISVAEIERFATVIGV